MHAALSLDHSVNIYAITQELTSEHPTRHLSSWLPCFFVTVIVIGFDALNASTLPML
jgi:hypothetical protein